ncbi:malonic semialdehyde reductase [Bordetella petrii]|uniref:Putative NADH dehydrogenase/NAD(P)H nitroreductase QUC21_11465 n=1 Tax=Bordetella petrii TaxID=94624 RepID=A0ABT7W383_9BORD|nr:malonic semialdehyde reductase [Bordetella petrii]MDM9559649.1 malonic semialdehyde reductase [Bordetella petrii]
MHDDALARAPGRLDDRALDQLFRQARSVRSWQQREVSADVLRQLYELMRLGPTSANCQPARVHFVVGARARARLLPLLDAGNVEPTRHAPVTAVVGFDLRFYENLPRLYAHQPDAVSWFNASTASAREAALRNGSLQGGYFIMAARALGLDCGPMGGFDASAAAREFFPGADVEVNFLCNLGYGQPGSRYPRLPRLEFDEACVIS